MVKLVITDEEYKLIRGLLERGYYIAKDEGNYDDMQRITELERMMIDLDPRKKNVHD